jgi:hypothetical protein
MPPPPRLGRFGREVPPPSCGKFGLLPPPMPPGREPIDGRLIGEPPGRLSDGV